MELEESIKTLNSYKKAFIFETEPPLNDYAEALETVLHYIKEESIPRAIVEEVIKGLDRNIASVKFYEEGNYRYAKRILREILAKGEKDEENL